MVNRYHTQNLGVDFDLVFHNGLTIIGGNSGIGKTVLFEALENDSILGYINAVCLNYDDTTSGIIDKIIDNPTSDIVVVDNADSILTPENKSKISMDSKHQYIIFAHSIQGFHPTEKSLAELSIKNGKGTLEYYLM